MKAAFSLNEGDVMKFYLKNGTVEILLGEKSREETGRSHFARMMANGHLIDDDKIYVGPFDKQATRAMVKVLAALMNLLVIETEDKPTHVAYMFQSVPF